MALAVSFLKTDIISLTKDIKTSFATVSSYLNLLELSYLIFRIEPYSKKIARSLTKEPKVYFYDWTRIDDPGTRFENYVALELKALTDFWTDIGEYRFKMHYIRTRDGKETDFLILKDNTPWMLIEAKNSKTSIEYHHRKNREVLGKNIPFVQVVAENKIAEKREKYLYQISASRFFG